MIYVESAVARDVVDNLLDVAAAIRDLSCEMRDVPRISAVVASFMEVERVVLAVVRQTPNSAPQIVTLGSFPPNRGITDRAFNEAMIRDEILALAASEDISGRLSSYLDDAAAAERCQITLRAADPENSSSDAAGVLVIMRPIDRTHRMMMVVGQTGGAMLEQDSIDTLQVICNHLARSLRALLSGLQYPPQLGAPFTGLTEREWVVLCALDSDDGEKQLAAQLGLSCHTVHSHIKSIYRKVGVQGRLPLLQRFKRAMQEYRLRSLPTAGSRLRAERVAG